MANYNGQQQQQSTTIPQTIYGQGTANGIITGYGSPISIKVACSNSLYNNATIANLSAVLAQMENNNSISNAYNSNNEFQVASGNLSSYSIYKYFQKSANATRFNCLNFTGPAEISLPSVITLNVGNQKARVPVTGNYRNVSIILSLLKGINTSISLRISGLITANGTLYGPIGVSTT